MKDLRNLLIDCRIELRKSLRDFHKTDLCGRLDQAIQNATALAESAAAMKAVPTASSAESANGSAPSEGHGRRHTTHQVAMAWQQVTRDLKFSNPPLYDELRAKVLSRIEAKTLVDESTELRELETKLALLQETLDEDKKHYSTLQLERDSLVGALSKAVPELADGGDGLAVALARIEWLKSQKGLPASTANRDASGNGSGTGGTNKTPDPPVDHEAPVPSAEVLAAVAAGARKFSDRQREWSVAEAMVLSGFQYTPVELLAQGDTQVASIILAAKPA